MRFAKERADHRLMPAGFVAQRAAQPVVILQQDCSLLRHRPLAEIRASGNDDARGFTAGVGIDDFEWSMFHAPMMHTRSWLML